MLIAPHPVQQTLQSITAQPEVSIIIPAYNEQEVIGTVVSQVIQMLENCGHTYEILVVNDGSKDNTALVAEEAGATVISHPYNIGNGAAVKSGIRRASGAIVLMMDGDGQHKVEDIPRLLEEMKHFDMVIGARTRASNTDWHRNVANGIYNVLASYVCNRPIEDLTSGFRAVRTDIAKGFVYLLPNTFSYPSTITLAVIRAGHSVKYIPIVTNRRVGHSKINLVKDGIRFLTIILRVSVFFAPLRVFVPTSIFIFFMGFLWYVYAVFIVNRPFPPTSIIVMLTSVLVFFMGLISEQIAQLRYDRTE